MNFDNIKAAFDGKIGWRQRKNPDSEYDPLLTMQSSESGLFYNDIHSLLTYDNIASAVREDQFDAAHAAYDGGEANYKKGTIVEDGGTLYIRLVDDGVFPTSNTTYWRQYNETDNQLREWTEGAISNTVREWVRLKANRQTARKLLERVSIVPTTGDIRYKYEPGATAHMVGNEIQPRKSRSVVQKIQRVGFMGDTDGETVLIKVFESGKKDPLYTETITGTVANEIKYASVEWELSGDKRYFICYDDSTLSGNAINSLTGVDSDLELMRRGRHFKTRFFSKEGAQTEYWDISENNYTESNNYGLHIETSVHCDYTGLIVEQADLFYDVIMLGVAIHVLRAFAMNPHAIVDRNNNNMERQDVLYEIDGDSQGNVATNKSLKTQYYEAMDAVSFDWGGIDKPCLPQKRRGLSWGY